MISLTYLSTATASLSADELGELLQSVREKNHAGGRTGMMVYAGGHFFQTLEQGAQAYRVSAATSRRRQSPRATA